MTLYVVCFLLGTVISASLLCTGFLIGWKMKESQPVPTDLYNAAKPNSGQADRTVFWNPGNPLDPITVEEQAVARAKTDPVKKAILSLMEGDE